MWNVKNGSDLTLGLRTINENKALSVTPNRKTPDDPIDNTNESSNIPEKQDEPGSQSSNPQPSPDLLPREKIIEKSNAQTPPDKNQNQNPIDQDQNKLPPIGNSITGNTSEPDKNELAEVGDSIKVSSLFPVTEFSIGGNLFWS